MKIKGWRGLSGVMAALLIIALCLTTMAWDYSVMINNFLGLVERVVVPGDSNEDTQYYKSSYGSLEEVKEAARLFSIREMEEGAVLVKNNGVLPLQDVSKVTLLGRASYDTIYRNGSAGPGNDQATLVTLKGGFEKAGIAVNDTVYNAYASSTTTRNLTKNDSEMDIGEEAISFYTDSLVSSFASFGDAAVVVLSRTASEGIDATTSDSEGISQLSLHQSEKDLLNLAHEHFSKIIVLINSGNAMELDWLDEYHVDACLLIGTPGNFGCEAVVNVLTGKANPSGRLVDTYATSAISSAAAQNAGNFVYGNAKEHGLGLISRNNSDISNKYLVYAEGIYVGYKYYETRYEDAVLDRYNASGKAGVFASADGWSYAEEVLYPFGYGLSYTSFTQTLDEVKWENKTVTATVTVTNSGSMAGKSAVQFYFQSPYTDYDRENLVEKSAIQIVAFDKTKLLQPGESQTLTLTADEYLLTSYDSAKTQGYILDAGDYYFAIGDNAHDALNNILAAKGASGLTDHEGQAVSGSAAATRKFVRDVLDTTYATSQYTGVQLQNRMATADINTWMPGAVTYLTRQDWNTFPRPVELSVTDEMAALLKANNSTYAPDERYIMPEGALHLSDFVQGAQNDITFISMRDVAYEDEEKWNLFLDQLTLQELADLTNHGGADSVTKPATRQGDGGDGANNVQFCGATVSACTYSPEIMQIRGDLMAELDLWAGISAHWAPGGDLHRTPFGGRNFEYYAEDAIMSYIYESIECGAMQAKGLMAMPKHFAGNDQETNRRGVCTWAAEQTWREGPLKGFEGAYTVGGAMGTMTGYHRYGMVFTAESSFVNIDILRGEWGFKGATITDGGSGSTLDMFTSGTDLSCLSDRSGAIMQYLSENDDGYFLSWLRNAAKNVCYADLRSNLINGLSSTATIQYVTPWWKTAILAVDVALAVLALASAAMYIYTAYIRKPKNKA